jgi:hypothetical protein
VTRCPICKSEAAEIDCGLFDGVGFDCRFHGRFRVSGTVLAQRKRRRRRQWEHALMLAKARASDGLPLISSELLWAGTTQSVCVVQERPAEGAPPSHMDVGGPGLLADTGAFPIGFARVGDPPW